MDKALLLYSNVLKVYLSNCFANTENISPIELNKERFRVKAIFTASMIFLKNNPENNDCKIVLASDNYLKRTFANDNLFSQLILETSQNLINIIDENLNHMTGIETIDIPTFYETLLGIESNNENSDTTTISASKNYRNKLGSYYTPSKLANTVTKKTIDTFFELNFGIKKLSAAKKIDTKLIEEITSITYSDFSCGGGNFLISVIDYFDFLLTDKINEQLKSDVLKTIALNISAFDVDCLALEVAKLNLLLKIDQPSLYPLLKDKFIHANFLTHCNVDFDSIEKVNIFASGFIYHKKLSLNTNTLKKYDIILGNPPWEKIRFEEKRFYALYDSSISINHFKSSRAEAIKETEFRNSSLASFAKLFKSEIEEAKIELKKSALFNLSNKGELNTYALFTNLALKLRTDRGVIGLVLKSAVITSQVNQTLFKFITKEKLTVAIYDFINRNKIFNIDSRERFCFLLLGTSKSTSFQVSMNLRSIDEIEHPTTKLQMSYDSLALLNPFTGMLPNFSNKMEADFLLRVSHDFPFFKNVYEDVNFGRIVHLTSHADYISKTNNSDNIAVYEGKFFNQFDAKFSGFNGMSDSQKYGNKSSSVLLNDLKKNEDDYFPESRFFINAEKWSHISKKHSAKFMLAWRSLTSATNTRTCIATLLPFTPALQSVQFLTTNQNDLLYLTGLFNSVVFDFILKKKLSGIDLTQSVINQIPVPAIEQTESQIVFNGSNASIKSHILTLVFSLLENDSRLRSLKESFKSNSDFSNLSRSATIRNIDLLFMYLYKLSIEEVEMIVLEFSKQYTIEDLLWFQNELQILIRNNSVSSTVTTTTFSPVS